MNLSETDNNSASSIKQAKVRHHESNIHSFLQECPEGEKLARLKSDNKAFDPLSSAHSADGRNELILDTCSLNLSIGLNRIKTRPGQTEDDPSGKNHATSKRSSGGVFERLQTQPASHTSSAVQSKGRQDAQDYGLVGQIPKSKEEEQIEAAQQYFDCCIKSRYVKLQPDARQKCNEKEKKLSFYHAIDLKYECCSGSDAEDTESSRGQFMRCRKEAPARHRGSKDVKSFSHELGLRKSHPQVLPRPHSVNNLEDMLENLQVSFNTAKEEVDMELALFAGDLVEILDTCTDLLVGWREKVEDLLILARRCAVMPVCEFQNQCEQIVHGLDDQHHELPPGFLKDLHTRMLFILSRCTRLLQFHRETKTQEEGSFVKLQQCLRGIPSFERVWVEKKEKPSCGTYKALQHMVENSLEQQSCFFVRKNSGIDKGPIQTGIGRKDDVPQVDSLEFPKEVTGPSYEHLVLNDREARSIDDEPVQLICRICEEEIPISHLEAHSIFCVFADACDGGGLSLNERLINIADCLEKLSDSEDKPDFVKLLKSNLHDNSNNSSPKWSDLFGKDADVKSNQVKTSSSMGSLTPRSSLTTPRTCHLDSLWKEHGMIMESEDVNHIHELVDIARCAANKNAVDEEALDYLAACMVDLQNVLQHCKNEALAVFTFGRHIEEILREKDMLVSELITHQKSDIENSFLEEDSLVAEDSCYDLKSTPSFPLYKDRTTIQDFVILKPISRGAYGKVFLARKRTTGDLFAIKVLRKVDMIRKNAVENILAERDILITVCNPFVVRFFYSFTCKENLYLVMEYLNGGDLFSLLKNMGCLDESVACVYIAELVLALEYLHSLGIVHRDLKPDNILIAHDGHIKLTDFGLSKVGLINSTDDFSTPANASVLTNMHSGQIITDHTRASAEKRSAAGTPDYLAPEILLGREHGHSADWWSVGAILFECLTGIPPFSGNQSQVIFENILNRKIPWPSPEAMSHEARDIIDKFLIQNPSERLGSRGTNEVKSHPFFRNIDWDTLAMQKVKVAFVPNPASVDDTSYFQSRPFDDGLYCLHEHLGSRECSCGSSFSTSSGKGRQNEVVSL